MPEGVEVKISADLIRPLIVDRVITDIEFMPTGRYNAKAPEGFTEMVKFFSQQGKNFACKIKGVQTKGKFMYWTLADDWHILFTYGMTGQLSPEEGKHVCMKVCLDDEPFRVYFNDPRHFGTVKFVNSYAKMNLKLSSLGWDPLQEPLDKWAPYISGLIVGSNKPIGQLLMDQSIFAGVGNYIRAEALYQARISPWRRGNQMTSDDLKALYEALVSVMKESYDHQGATILTYKDAYGAEGKYSSCFKVYGQKKDPLGNPIIKEDTPDKRTIHWCPSIQI